MCASRYSFSESRTRFTFRSAPTSDPMAPACWLAVASASSAARSSRPARGSSPSGFVCGGGRIVFHLVCLVLCHTLSHVVTRCHTLSHVVTRCHTLSHSQIRHVFHHTQKCQ